MPPRKPGKENRLSIDEEHIDKDSGKRKAEAKRNGSTGRAPCLPIMWTKYCSLTDVSQIVCEESLDARMYVSSSRCCQDVVSEWCSVLKESILRSMLCRKRSGGKKRQATIATSTGKLVFKGALFSISSGCLVANKVHTCKHRLV